VRQTAVANSVEIIAPQPYEISGLTFTPDGNYLDYTLWEDVQAGRIYQIPVLGGPARRLTKNSFSDVTFSPDGRQMAFARIGNAGTEADLVIANTNGEDEHTVLTHKISFESWDGVFQLLRWSNDGENIVAAMVGASSDGQKTFLLLIDPRNGREKQIAGLGWRSISDLDWLPDGSVRTSRTYERTTGYFARTGRFPERKAGACILQSTDPKLGKEWMTIEAVRPDREHGWQHVDRAVEAGDCKKHSPRG